MRPPNGRILTGTICPTVMSSREEPLTASSAAKVTLNAGEGDGVLQVIARDKVGVTDEGPIMIINLMFFRC